MAKTTKTTDQPINLFGNIALTFSGGGYRASTFALGVLSYLNQVALKNKPLLENVKGLSTVSGGTLTGATYAYHKSKGEDFKSFYKRFYSILKEDELLGVALAKLDADKVWKDSHKKRSLINAFALAYAELLTNGTFSNLIDNKSHLEDICFNATDFSFGLAFRFQTTGDFGNYRLNNSNLDILSKEMKLADAIASSSCFPTGFEPLVMPDDFVSNHNSDAYVAIKAQKDFANGIGIMDGGIVDNQGIGSIMNANARRKDKYDLIMVCDVGSYFMDPWEPSTIDMDKKGWAKTPIQLANKLIKLLKSNWWLWVIAFLSVVSLAVGFVYELGQWIFIIGGAFSMLLIIAIAVKYLMNKLDDELILLWDWTIKKIPGFMKDKLKYLDNLKLRLIKRMIIERGTSALTMISNIFMKQLRRLNYNLFYTDDKLKNRRITTLIYELTEKQYKHGDSDEKDKEEKRNQIDNPGDRIYAAAKIASEMGTTLWFSEEDKKVHRLKNLVSCGQFTSCYNLLKYCIDLKESGTKVDQALLDEMIKKFQVDWKKFIANPYWLHDNS